MFAAVCKELGTDQVNDLQQSNPFEKTRCDINNRSGKDHCKTLLKKRAPPITILSTCSQLTTDPLPSPPSQDNPLISKLPDRNSSFSKPCCIKPRTTPLDHEKLPKQPFP
eukprot:6464568-Amphidinium_carterae.1